MAPGARCTDHRGAILALIVQRRRGILGRLRLTLRPGQPVDALLLFAGLLSVVFVFSAFGQMAVEFPNTDTTGRYAAPLASVLPIILAAGITRLSARSRLLPINVSLVLLGAQASRVQPLGTGRRLAVSVLASPATVQCPTHHHAGDHGN